MGGPGSESRAKADKLAEKLSAVFADNVKVSRPSKAAEVRVSGCAADKAKDKKGGQKPSDPPPTVVAEQPSATAVTIAKEPLAIEVANVEMVVVEETFSAAVIEMIDGTNVEGGEERGNNN